MNELKTYLLWLEWPERCFRVQPEDMSLLSSLVAPGSRVIRAESREAFFAALPEATHVLTWYFEAAWFARAPLLKVLATPAAGRELLPYPDEVPAGVTVHFGAFHGPIMAESVAGFLLAWCRGFFLPDLHQSPWPRAEVCGRFRLLAGSHALVVGYGHVGRAIGEKLASLGVQVTGYTRHGFVPADTRSLDQVLPTIDWLIMALPHTPETDHFLSAERLNQLSPRAVVVNVGRGNAVDESALFAALAEGRLAGAYLDVRETEPQIQPPPALPNLILTPHASAFSADYLPLFFKELKNDGVL